MPYAWLSIPPAEIASELAAEIAADGDGRLVECVWDESLEAKTEQKKKHKRSTQTRHKSAKKKGKSKYAKKRKLAAEMGDGRLCRIRTRLG